MNSKNMAKHLSRKLKDWVQSIGDPVVAKVVKDNAIVTGGALVSLLTGEPPNDYDIYFKTFESCLVVADYYAKKWNEMYPNKPQVTINHDEDKRITAFIESVGVVLEDGEDGIDDESEPVYTDDDEPDVQEVDDRPKYRPRYFSTNAISLSDKIQLVIRFYGSVEEIHTNYDFVHCTCSYDFKENKVDLPSDRKSVV